MARRSGVKDSGTAVAVAIVVMNVATYGFTILAARLLGPSAYGAVAGLMATLLVITVAQLGLQTTAARRIAAHPDDVEQIEQSILRVSYRAALVLGLALLALAPVINIALQLDSLPTAALVALIAVPVTVTGGQAGILQGHRRWLPLAMIYVASGVPRLIIGVVLMSWRPDQFVAMLSVLIGALAPVVVGWVALRHAKAPAEHVRAHGARPMLKEALHNSHALLAFLCLSSVDIIVARNVLDDRDAGLYAGGLILTKAVLFLPQFVVVVAFPSMSTDDQRRRTLVRSVAVVVVLGAGCTLGTLLLPDLAMIFVGGNEYVDVQSRLWLFAVLGTVLSTLQVLVYGVLAQQARAAVYVVWVAFGVLVVAGLAQDSVSSLAVTVTVIDAARACWASTP